MSLPGEKLEKTDIGKESLAAFTKKVKERGCRLWASADELGSAVKSGIIHELEFNPKPGWIRADALPTSEAVEKLKQRIADLEEQLNARKPNKATFSEKTEWPEGNHILEIPVVIRCDYQTVVKKFQNPPNFHQMLAGETEGKIEEYEEDVPKKIINENISVSWDDLVLILACQLQQGENLEHIALSFEGGISEKIDAIVERELGKAESRRVYSASELKLEVAMKTLMAKKLVKMTARYGSWHDPNWQFTPKGLQYLAELQAIRGAI